MDWIQENERLVSGVEYNRATEGFAFPAPSSDWGTVTHSMMVLPNPKRRWWSFWRPRHIVIKNALLGDTAIASAAADFPIQLGSAVATDVATGALVADTIIEAQT